jgi:hypothetical protein
MADQLMSRCGEYCEGCKHRESDGSPGCRATQGKPFWGECKWAMCSISKGHEHCGQCQHFSCEIPCEIMNDYDGYAQNIRNVKAWNEIGYDAWRREQNA